MKLETFDYFNKMSFFVLIGPQILVLYLQHLGFFKNLENFSINLDQI